MIQGLSVLTTSTAQSSAPLVTYSQVRTGGGEGTAMLAVTLYMSLRDANKELASQPVIPKFSLHILDKTTTHEILD